MSQPNKKDGEWRPDPISTRDAARIAAFWLRQAPGRILLGKRRVHHREEQARYQ